MPPGIGFEQMDFRVFRGASPVLGGEAVKASLRRDTTALTGEGLRVRLPGHPGEPDVVLTAPEGRGSLREGWFEVWGGAVLRQGGTRCETERARYADGLVRGDRPVQIRGQGFALSGPGFLLDPRAGSVRIRGGGTLDARGGR